ncbi:ATP-grasp domain-containing protein [Nocardioides sp. ChNu-153]|uniref:ATP-binding protein n=1 Tax=Nocardioides sp. ChNu-153 TaxID=2779364 RepID=UPI00264DFAD3|nr:biotin carboxylase N-terminal domain-containing protein [Nocardioides sp. ChNu-153]MDN7122832.1 ATP-grasp domain-containing protein [Nocardioides sp. ChNu-153]
MTTPSTATPTSTAPAARPLRTLLVANRGEIALRVLRTATRMGLRTVALHTDLDAGAPHVRAADRAVRVASYLDVDEVVAAAVAAGADAVHPGYGFLSERAAFAAALEAAGVTLVGPSAAVMEQMGRKDAAREIAVAAGVPVVPRGDAGDADDAGGWSGPVLVKAAAGGGGKGMRVVRDPRDLDEAVAAARREALSAFGDDTILVERYVERGRHVEVQVVGDTHGTVLHLFERDCSTQRRHQKVLEEAPGPTVDAALRERLTSAAVRLAEHAGYVGAGTVEFLLDVDSGDFFFLEMNTRLQVEHPVTEAVCRVRGAGWAGGPAGAAGEPARIDLVEWQLRVAAGEPLPVRQDDLVLVGHAIEARVYAEDSHGGFLPQAGTASYVRWPTAARVDHALESGQEVTTAYDPMLGKVVAEGPDREAARRALLAALDSTVVLGLTTNTGFLRTLVASDEFRDASIHTAWLDHAEVPAPDPAVPLVVGAWADARAGRSRAGGGAFRADGWRIAGARAPWRTVLGDTAVVVDGTGVTPEGGGTAEVRLLGERVLPAGTGDAAGGAEVRELSLLVDGERVDVTVAVRRHAVEVAHRGQRHVLARPLPPGDRAAPVGDGALTAPMPGTVLDVRTAVGDAVAAGQVLVVLEAMKMEIALRAPFAGTVAVLGASTGAQVALGSVLVEVAPTAGGEEDHRAAPDGTADDQGDPP